jgi:mRNA interferase MazF
MLGAAVFQVLAAAGRDDYIICQVPSNLYADLLAVELSQASFASGSLQRTSYARPGKLFTAHVSLMRAQVGTLTRPALRAVVERVIQLLQPGTSS